MHTDRLQLARGGYGGWLVIALFTAVLGCGDDDDLAAHGNSMDAGPTVDAGASGSSGGGHPSVDGGGLNAGSLDASEPTADAGDAGVPASDSDSDGGAQDAAPGDAAAEPEAPAMPLPMNGEQLAVCTQPTDCDPGLGCYAEGPGQAFCTSECTIDKDCADLKNADYSCSPDGLCEVDCGGGPPGVDKCPEGLVCTQVSGPGPGGIRNRCKYSASAGSNGNEFSACSVPEDCDDGLQCLGAFLTVPGYCTHACSDSSECTTQPSSGSITASCLANTCVLSCEDDPTGCPDGMSCIETPLFSQCAYQ